MLYEVITISEEKHTISCWVLPKNKEFGVFALKVWNRPERDMRPPDDPSIMRELQNVMRERIREATKEVVGEFKDKYGLSESVTNFAKQSLKQVGHFKIPAAASASASSSRGSIKRGASRSVSRGRGQNPKRSRDDSATTANSRSRSRDKTAFMNSAPATAKQWAQPQASTSSRITSYNVCYTKLLRTRAPA